MRYWKEWKCTAGLTFWHKAEVFQCKTAGKNARRGNLYNFYLNGDDGIPKAIDCLPEPNSDQKWSKVYIHHSMALMPLRKRISYDTGFAK